MNVFVAPKIKVGFQKRQDTFTGRLAYVIYYDEKGKLRKEQSWQTWRDKSITPEEFDNVPIEGFTLNKDIKRYNGDWFSSHRTMIRVHDPRGFEFEVTTENLIGILMHTDCLRRGLIGQFVYAWMGAELVLLPTNSEEYQKAVKYTGGLVKKVKAKDLIPGVSYKTKREGDVIFMGKLNWYEYPSNKRSRLGERKEEKTFVFTNDDGETFFKKDSVTFLAEPNNEQPVSNFAELMDKFNKESCAHKIVNFEFRPVTFDPTTHESHFGPALTRESYLTLRSDGTYGDCRVTTNNKYQHDATGKGYYVVDGYHIDESYYQREVIKPNGEVLLFNGGMVYSYSYSHRQGQSLEYMQSMKFFDLFVTFENGEERRVKTVYDLTSENY